MTQGERFGVMLFTWCGGCLVLALLAIFRPNDVRVWMQLSLLAYGLLVGTFGLLSHPGDLSKLSDAAINAWTTCIVSAVFCWAVVLLWWLTAREPHRLQTTSQEIQSVMSRLLVGILAVGAGGGLRLWKGKDT